MIEGPSEKPKIPGEEAGPNADQERPEDEASAEPKNSPESAGPSPEEGKEQIKREALSSSDALKTFVTRIGLREKAGMDPFMDPAVRQLMHEAAQEFHDAGRGLKEDTDIALRDALIAVAAAFRGMEKQNRGTRIIESSKNLQALFTDLRPLHASAARMEGMFKERDDTEGFVAAASVRKEVERVGDFLGKLHAAYARYERG